MTQYSDRNGLAIVVEGAKAQWMGRFLFMVIGHPQIFATLGPAVNPVTGHIPGGAHFWRTLAPLKTGMLNPGNGSYAKAMNGAHRPVPTELVTASTSWYVTTLCQIALGNGQGALLPKLIKAGKEMAVDFNADPDGVDFDLQGLRSTFAGITILAEAKGALWDVVHWDKLYRALGRPNDRVLLSSATQILPQSFVNQFRR